MFVQSVDRAEPPPVYEVTDVSHNKTESNTFMKTMAETENRMADLSLSEIDASSSSHNTSLTTQALFDPPPKFIDVQERVKCLATNKKERKDARRAEKAMKIEAWKERKQAKRIARAAWREERRAVRA